MKENPNKNNSSKFRGLKMKYTVDIQATLDYNDLYNEPCPCTYCRNYEEAFPKTYPEVVEILKTFGIRVERPLEVMEWSWNDTKDKRKYSSFYSVKGELFQEELVIYDKDVMISLFHSDSNKPLYRNTGMKKPYFILEIWYIELPWVLPKPPDE